MKNERKTKKQIALKSKIKRKKQNKPRKVERTNLEAMWKTKAARMHTNAPIMASGLSTGHSLMRLRQDGESETFCKQGTGSSHNAIFGTRKSH